MFWQFFLCSFLLQKQYIFIHHCLLHVLKKRKQGQTNAAYSDGEEEEEEEEEPLYQNQFYPMKK